MSKINPADLLKGMYSDGYFPNPLVDKVRDVLLDACNDIESQNPADLDQLYAITHHATERINDLQEDFFNQGSEIETAARDDIATSFAHIANTYGFAGADIEELVATREW